MVRMSDDVIDSFGNVRRVFVGSVTAIVTTIILLIIYSAVLTYTNISENTIPMVTLVITGLSILLGSGIAGSKVKKKGLITGMMVGGIYILSIYLLSSIVSGNFGMSMFSIIMIVVGMVSGAFGGIIGVNRA